MRTIIEKNEKNILEYCIKNGIKIPQTDCGGRGTCGKCKVRLLKDDKEVLACKTPAEEGMEIEISNSNLPDNEMIVEDRNSELKYKPDRQEEGIVGACDIGTTTVVCHLIDVKTGEILKTTSAANDQRRFGADVVSRISAANDKNELLHQDIIRQIKSMFIDITDGKVLKKVYAAGNTVMSHFLIGESPAKIGRAPFMPDELFGKSFGRTDFCDELYIFPAVSGYVGGDITAGVMAAVNPDKMTLFLDIGTNGEMVLGKGEEYFCCATAAGPAFEGAEIEMGMSASKGAIDRVWIEDKKICHSVIGDVSATGICGSGLVDAVKVCLDIGILDNSGEIKNIFNIENSYKSYVGSVYEDEEDDDLCIHLSPTVYILQEDIRKLQLAKSAIATGIQVLMDEAGVTSEQIDEVVLAGGFGNYIDVESAAAIGLLPQELLGKTVGAKNAAGAGAINAAISEEAWLESQKLAKQMKYIELSKHERFEELFIHNMNF